PPLGLHWPDLAVPAGMPLLRAIEVTVAGRLGTPVELDIGGGDRLLVTGPNGSGKSTLLNVLARHLAPSTGQVQHLGEAKVRLLGQEVPRWPKGHSSGELYRRRAWQLASRELLAEDEVVPLNEVGLLDDEAIATEPARMSQGQQRRLHLALVL